MNWRKLIILAGLYLTVICEKGIFQKVGVTGREIKYILTRHKPDRSINKYDMSTCDGKSLGIWVCAYRADGGPCRS